LRRAQQARQKGTLSMAIATATTAPSTDTRFPNAAPAPDSRATEILLWPEGAPGSEGMTAPEILDPPGEQSDHYRLRSIHRPSITAYLAPPEVATGAAIVIAPGGGHRWLAIDTEGYFVAEYLNTIGVSAFVLKYRLAREEGSPYSVEVHALQDALRAIRLLRHRAGEWGIDPARVGIMGFSAGAAVTLLAATRYDAGDQMAADPIDRHNSHPDFQVPIYGGTRQLDALRFTADTPPAFLLGASDDALVGDSLPHLYLALKQAGVPVELHVYASGGHGFGLRKVPKPNPCATTWHLRLADWLADRCFLARGNARS
jgi:endo-1,4-beta-xylanase